MTRKRELVDGTWHSVQPTPNGWEIVDLDGQVEEDAQGRPLRFAFKETAIDTAKRIFKEFHDAMGR